MRAGQKPHMRRMTYTCRVLAIALVFVVLETTLHHALKSRDESFLEIAKCPACFGVSMCPSFYNGEIALGTWSQFSAAMNVNSKNVYNANYKDKEVVLKKLGHDFKLSKLDKYIQLHSHSAAEHTLLSEHEDVATAIRTLTLRYVMSSYEPDRIGKNGKSVHHLKIFESAANISRVMEPDFNGSELLTCPSQRKIDIFEDRVFAKSQGLYRLTFLYNFMTMLLLNSEPLVFQTFPAEEGWPFPVYLGACGRLVVEENVGPTLDQWLPSAHWVDRVHSALQLLSIAKQFTLGVSGLRLYLTDLSLYNVAVDPQKSLRIIDGGNIVIVDLKQIEKERPTDYDVPYTSDNAGCADFSLDPDCISYSEQDLCTRLVNDHNFFAVCRQLFSPVDDFGLLNLPEEVTHKFPQLAKYQQQCYQPSENEGDRIQAAAKLVDIYNDITVMYSN